MELCITTSIDGYPEINDHWCLEMLDEANKKVFFEIDGNMNEIISAWKNKYYSEEANLCCNNCADATIWFLDTFAGISNPGSWGRPFTCNYLFCGLFAPSFLQPCAIPGRVVDYAKARTQETSPLIPSMRMDK
jgi:hypothetical protein